ncbi:uncharacterized protein LOC134205368 isoform X2 [Armigeres subalbatus]|uniref:uncharacterized protein LOC134205368 isoform X2 n=1 Tax=Armigeres subalbatus TaxID=124917 RepID=UPI002ED4B5F5
MSKRCCAASCYNSVATNRSVEYFGFPKSTEFSAAWAKAAGREDLLDKSINNIIKYFLCSEHFSNECFLDPPHNTKLKKTIRPVVVPIPTIFHNNFNECVSKSLKDDRPVNAATREEDMIDFSLGQERVSGNLINGDRTDDSTEIHLSTESVEALILTSENDVIISNVNEGTNDLEVFVPGIGSSDNLKIGEEHMLTIIDPATPEQDQNDGVLEAAAYTEIFVGPTSCRLCLSTKENELLIPIFSYGSEAAYILESLLPGTFRRRHIRRNL